MRLDLAPEGGRWCSWRCTSVRESCTREKLEERADMVFQDGGKRSRLCASFPDMTWCTRFRVEHSEADVDALASPEMIAVIGLAPRPCLRPAVASALRPLDACRKRAWGRAA